VELRRLKRNEREEKTEKHNEQVSPQEIIQSRMINILSLNEGFRKDSKAPAIVSYRQLCNYLLLARGLITVPRCKTQPNMPPPSSSCIG